MLFNSVSFICIFLPVTLILFFLIGRFHQRSAMAWLGIASLTFYSWLGAHYLPLLLVSIIFNYSLGLALERYSAREHAAAWLLSFGVTANLLALVYYKYLFDLTGWAHLHGIFTRGPIGNPMLPLGISFFTFTQIGFLVDRRAGVTKARNFIEYLLFVTFFPHLIAGPILHHREIMPQFLREATYRFDARNFAVGLSIFIIGLAKKVVVADRFSPFVSPGFAQPHELGRMDAWCCVLSYFIQLYFDFSGYSEMALGLARMFNVTFPANFDSPYKAPNIIEFWQRWHMSLTRYVTLYVYNPIALAITRRRYANGKPANAGALRTIDGFAAIVMLPTLVTMVLIGIWHGAGLQFLIFGLLHGCYLCIAHAWRIAIQKKPARRKARSTAISFLRTGPIPGILLTCLAVLLAQVFFRAASVGDACRIVGAMTFWPAHAGLPDTHHRNLEMIGLALAWLWTMPNILQIFATQSPALAKSRAQPALLSIAWRPTPAFGAGLAVLFLYSFLSMAGTSEFLYFRF